MRRNSFGRGLRKFDFRRMFQKDLYRAGEQKKLVLKLQGEQCLDPISLNNIVHRAYKRNVSRCHSLSPRKTKWEPHARKRKLGTSRLEQRPEP